VEPDWYGQDEFNFTATAGITTTIFDGGRIKTDITLGEQELREALYGYQQGRESIETHLRKTLRKIDLNREKINYYQLKCSTDEEQVELKKTQYESGAGSEREYLQALITLYADRAVVLREKIEFFNNFFTIKNITNDF
jgi:outer membrane protein TolC